MGRKESTQTNKKKIQKTRHLHRTNTLNLIAYAHYGRVDDSPYSMGEQNVTCVPKFVLITKTRYKIYTGIQFDIE